MEEFITWLEEQLRERDWQPSDLGRRAGLGNSTVTRILSGERKPGVNVCLAIAEALGEPEEKVLRLAGILPPLPALSGDRVIGEIVDILKHLRPEQRQDVLEYALWRFQQQGQRKNSSQAGQNEPDSKSLRTIESGETK